MAASSASLPTSSPPTSNLLSIVSPVAYSSSSCGYCTPPASGVRSHKSTSHSYGIWAHRLSPYHYNILIDRGWRRSGDYIYKPDLARTCCKQIPIRLNPYGFRPRKAQKRALSNLLFSVRTEGEKPARWKGKWSRGRDWDPEKRWHIAEWDSTTDSDATNDPDNTWADKVAGKRTKKLQTILRLASATDEKYQLFRRYQSKVHGEADAKISKREGWERFLVDTCMTLAWPDGGEPLDDDEEKQWRSGKAVVDPRDATQRVPLGCYHQEYRLDGKLIAVGVLDVLPSCLSSVYLFYDPDFDHLELGKISALREIALTKQLARKPGLSTMQHYYLGFYIHNCQKMRYKADYGPCELLDCATNQWRPYTSVRGQLDAGQVYDFDQRRAASPAVPVPPDTIGHHTAQPRGRGNTEALTAKDADVDGASESEDDGVEDKQVPTDPSPPPGTRDWRAMMVHLDRFLSRLFRPSSDSPPVKAAGKEGEEETMQLLARTLVLDTRRQERGVQRFLDSTILSGYITSPSFVAGEGAKSAEVEGGRERERVRQTVECLASLIPPSAAQAREEGMRGLVLFV